MSTQMWLQKVQPRGQKHIWREHQPHIWMSGLDCEWFSKYNHMGIDPSKVENITNIGTSVEIEEAFKGRDGGLVGR